jgi:hypothetical protein
VDFDLLLTTINDFFKQPANYFSDVKKLLQDQANHINKIKHDKELKVTTGVQQINRSFVYGKLNNMFTLRGGIGLQRELYQKRDVGGISIRYFYTFGPALGLLKPIYYEVYKNDKLVLEKYSEHATINGRASFFKGVGETTFTPGLYGKIGATFEFSKLDAPFHAIETGAMIDAYLKEMPLMDVSDHRNVFLTLFISYRFGTVINAQFTSGQTKIDEVLTE